MPKRIKLSVLALVAIVTVPVGQAQQAQAFRMIPAARDVPYEVVVGEADLIVTATVTAVPKTPAPVGGGGMGGGVARRRPLIQAGASEATFKVEKALSNPGKIEIEGKEISVTFGYPGRAAPKVGDKVVFAIKKMEENKYYVLPYANAFSTDAEKAAGEFAKYTDMDKWNWGKESNGLRSIALSRSVTMNPQTGAAQMQISMAIHNVGKESVFLNTYPGDNFLLMKAFWDGTPIAGQLAFAGNAGPYEGGTYFMEIKPGALAWISQWGPSVEGSNFAVQSPDGKCAVQLSYASSRDGTVAGGQKLWKGTVTSGEITVEVPKPGETRQPGRVRPVPNTLVR